MSDPINLNVDPQTTGQSIGSLMQLTAQAAPAVQGYFQNKEAKDRALELEAEQLKLDKDLQSMLANRQTLRNPYANLGVNTQAAEFEAQQKDATFANTLDTMRAGGFGGSGATALARAAAEAKQGVAADISTQEQSNRTKFAEGEAKLQTAVEERQVQDINALQTDVDNARDDAAEIRAAGQSAQSSGLTSAVSGITNTLAQNPDMLSGLFGG
jgi:hypothetical protein